MLTRKGERKEKEREERKRERSQVIDSLIYFLLRLMVAIRRNGKLEILQEKKMSTKTH